MLKTTTRIIVTLRWAGFHFWPEPRLPAQRYLGNLHRHEFHITVKKVVKDGEREIEFIDFKQRILEYLKGVYPDGNIVSKSCETLAADLYLFFNLSYCSVMEDGENGAEIF